MTVFFCVYDNLGGLPREGRVMVGNVICVSMPSCCALFVGQGVGEAYGPPACTTSAGPGREPVARKSQVDCKSPKVANVADVWISNQIA